MVIKTRDESEVRRLLGISADTHLSATGNVNYFSEGNCYYRYASHGFVGWIVTITEPREINFEDAAAEARTVSA